MGQWLRFGVFTVASAAAACGSAPAPPLAFDLPPPSSASAAELPRSTPPRRAVIARRSTGTYEFEGTWRGADGSIWRLSSTEFYLRFPYGGGTRENFATIVEVDEASHHFVIKYDRSSEDGRPAQVPSVMGYVTYKVEGDSIRKWVAVEPPFAAEAADERFVLQPQ
jgi:hypothetical protein